MTAPDEQRLLSHLRAGRPEACAELIRVHYQAVYRLLVHLTRDDHLAEDLTQETFAAAWERIATFEGRASLATWLHRIAYTKFIDAQRARRRAEAMLDRRPSSMPVSADPLHAAMADDETQRLHRSMQELDAPERALLVLHYLQGMSYSEMAAVLDEPAGTVKWRTHVALNRLRDLLSDEVADHAPEESPKPDGSLEELEAKLRALPEPPVPAGLEARLLATIPAKMPVARRRWIGAGSAIGALAAAACLLAVFAWQGPWHGGGGRVYVAPADQLPPRTVPGPPDDFLAIAMSPMARGALGDTAMTTFTWPIQEKSPLTASSPIPADLLY